MPTSVTSLRLESAPEPSALLGRYRVTRRLGAGAFATVWQAHDERLGREVAIKVLPRERLIWSRFEREARAAARLLHPSIVTLYEAAADAHNGYLVCELVRGGTLVDRLEDGRVGDRDLLQVGIAVCAGLEHAHGQGVVHRDVKPSNILLVETSMLAGDEFGFANRPRVAKLADFGVARIAGGDSLTRAGDVVGTAAYMAPEQAEGLEAGAPADLYSLAVVVYEGLTGANPIRTGTGAQRARRLGAHLPPLRRSRPDLPRELAQAIDRALRPRPRERGTVEELHAALEQALDGLAHDDPLLARRLREHNPPRRRRVQEREPAPSPTPYEQPERRPLTLSAPAPAPRPRGRLLPALAGAAAAGWTAAWILGDVLRASAIGTRAGAVAAAVLVLVLPRLGWVSAAGALAAMALGQRLGGVAVMLAGAGLVPVLLLPHQPRLWPRIVLAPLLAVAGLAGAWPALAGRAAGAWQRAALGFAGWIWLTLASALSGQGLYASLPAATPARASWTPSAHAAIHQLLVPLTRSGLLVPGLVWALAAALAPGVLRRRSLAEDGLRALSWSLATVSATALILALGGRLGSIGLDTAILGLLAGTAVVLAPWCRASRTRPACARIPPPAGPREWALSDEGLA